jgi:hypothetical protein
MLPIFGSIIFIAIVSVLRLRMTWPLGLEAAACCFRLLKVAQA